MSTPEVEIKIITHDTDACFDAAQVVASRIKISEGPFAGPEDFKKKMELSLVLSAYQDDNIVGGLLAKRFGSRALSFVRNYGRKNYMLDAWNVQESYKRRPELHYGALVQPRPPALTGLSVEYVAVHHFAEGQGIGRLLMEHAIDYARDYGLEEVKLEQVPTTTRYSVQGFYDSLGFDPALGGRFNTRRLELNPEDY